MTEIKKAHLLCREIIRAYTGSWVMIIRTEGQEKRKTITTEISMEKKRK